MNKHLEEVSQQAEHAGDMQAAYFQDTGTLQIKDLVVGVVGIWGCEGANLGEGQRGSALAWIEKQVQERKRWPKHMRYPELRTKLLHHPGWTAHDVAAHFRVHPTIARGWLLELEEQKAEGGSYGKKRNAF